MRYNYNNDDVRSYDTDAEDEDYGGSKYRPGRGQGGRSRKHQCPVGGFSYKDVDTLRHYVSDSGKIKPRRQTGNCAHCQRSLARAVKRARHLGLLPFVAAVE